MRNRQNKNLCNQNNADPYLNEGLNKEQIPKEREWFWQLYGEAYKRRICTGFSPILFLQLTTVKPCFPEIEAPYAEH